MTTATSTFDISETGDTPLAAVAFAAVAGVLLLIASGIAQASVMHDAAHDQRHAMAFPCH